MATKESSWQKLIVVALIAFSFWQNNRIDGLEKSLHETNRELVRVQGVILTMSEMLKDASTLDQESK